jgi:threonine dehydrogenase-like Zn-dependent dehydrogenase
VRVARSIGVREVRVDEDADPEPGAGEVVCRVLACGVCGSDVSDAWVAAKLPVVLGHELTGEVDVVASYSAGPGDMRDAHALVASGRVDRSPFVTHRLPLEETGRALQLARSGEALKALVLP